MTVIGEIPRQARRLPAGPLLAAVDEAITARGVGLRRLFPASQVRAVCYVKADGSATPYMIGRLCAALGRDPRELYGDDLLEIPERPQPSSARPAARPPVRLPAGPALAAVDAYCAARGVGRTQALGVDGRKCRWRVQMAGTVSPQVARRLCDLIGEDPRVLYGDAWREPPAGRSSEVWRRDTSKPHLDAGPLVEAIEARLERLTQRLMPLTEPGPAHIEAVRVIFGDDERLKRAFYRARRRGWVLLPAAEQFCDAFGWHPRELWGDRYDTAALAGLPEDFDVWKGVA